MPRLQSHGKFASVPSDLSEESSPSTDPLNLPWGCPPGFSDRSKKIVELEEPTDFGLQQESSKKSVHSSAQSVVPKKNRSKITPWLMPKVPHSFVGRAPPFPSLKKTVDGHDFLCFFSKVYAFSNHYLAEFRIEGDLFSCSEQYYTWRKSKYFGFDVTADEIMENQHAKVIKQLGHADNLRERQRLGMEPNAREFDHDEWRKAKEEIMLIALRAKFTQNPKLGQMLAETEDALLVEASPTDKYWGDLGRAGEVEEHWMRNGNGGNFEAHTMAGIESNGNFITNIETRTSLGVPKDGRKRQRFDRAKDEEKFISEN